MDMALLIGSAGRERELSLAEMARELAEVLGFDLEKLPDRELFHGGNDSGHAWLRYQPKDEEPFLSHPFLVDVVHPGGPPLPYVNELFDRLIGLGRYRLILLIDFDCVRSTHFPCQDW